MKQKLIKPLLFGVCGALGCLIASVGGEIFLTLTHRQPPSVAVVMLIDTSGSMAGEKIAEVKQAASDFVQRQNLDQNQIAVIGFNSDVDNAASLSSDKNTLTSEIASLSEGGATRMDLGIEAAISELKSSQSNPSILLFTDGMPNSPDLTVTAAQSAKNQGINLVAVATGDADTQFLALLTGNPELVFPTNSGEFDQAFQKAGKAIFAKQLVESGATGDYGIIFGTLRIGTWTAILAIGISIALIAGQNRYSRRRLLSQKEAIVGTLGGLGAGLVAGSIGQLIYIPLATIPILATGGQILGWTILGTLLGGGMSFFVPNLQKNKALLGGAIGGLVGGVSFVLMMTLGGAIAGRLVGAAIIGFSIGIMIALLEMLSREARLLVEWTPTEKTEMLLGKRPIVLGSSEEADIYLPKNLGYLPVTVKIFKDGESVIMEFMPEYAEQKGLKITRQELADGAKRKFGDVLLEIKMDKG